MMMDNLRGRLRTWFHRRSPGSYGPIPTTPLPGADVSRTMEHAQPPPIPIAELPQLESDIVVMEAGPEDPDMRAWADAFAAATRSGKT